jgi:hypothetical protein
MSDEPVEAAAVPRIVGLFGHDTPEGKCIDGVHLSDGTTLNVEDVSPAMWAAVGVVQADGKPLGTTQ